MISVIVAAKDEEENIGGCLSSLRQVLGVDDEVIVVDDGSDDDTARVAASIPGLTVRVVRNRQSLGRAQARNLGVDASRFDLLAIQDADDVALPDRLIPAKLLFSDPALVAASGQCVTLTEAGRPWRHAQYPLNAASISAGLDRGIMTLCHTGSVIRKKAFFAAGGYDARYARAQDLDLFRKLDGFGDMANANNYVVLYRHNVVLPWRYWSLSRSMRKDILGEDHVKAAFPVLYPLAQTRRVAIFLRTHRAMRRVSDNIRGLPS